MVSLHLFLFMINKLFVIAAGNLIANVIVIETICNCNCSCHCVKKSNKILTINGGKVLLKGYYKPNSGVSNFWKNY